MCVLTGIGLTLYLCLTRGLIVGPRPAASTVWPLPTGWAGASISMTVTPLLETPTPWFVLWLGHGCSSPDLFCAEPHIPTSTLNGTRNGGWEGSIVLCQLCSGLTLFAFLGTVEDSVLHRTSNAILLALLGGPAWILCVGHGSRVTVYSSGIKQISHLKEKIQKTIENTCVSADERSDDWHRPSRLWTSDKCTLTLRIFVTVNNCARVFGIVILKERVFCNVKLH